MLMETIMMLIINKLCEVFDSSSFIMGMLSSGIIWWIILKSTTPQLLLSSKIVKKSSDNYLIKIHNSSYFRGVYNIIVHAVYCTANENYHREELTTVAYLKHKPWFSKKKKVEQGDKPYEMKIRFTGPKIGRETYQPLTNFLANSPAKNTNKAFLDIIIICYDRYTGTAKQVITNRYFTEDMEENVHFEEGGVRTIPNDDSESGTQN